MPAEKKKPDKMKPTYEQEIDALCEIIDLLEDIKKLLEPAP